MFLTFESTDGKLLHSHSSLLDEEKQLQIKKIYNDQTWYTRGITFATFYLMMEAVNRVRFLKAKSLLHRTLYVAVPTIFSYYLSDRIYWGGLNKRREIIKLCEGAPLYTERKLVPELDKAFFFLDDDHNYEPNLLHHGMYEI